MELILEKVYVEDELVGCEVEYKTSDGETRTAKIDSVYWSNRISKLVYECVSPYGHTINFLRHEFKVVISQ